MVLGGCIYGCNRTKFGRIRSGPRLRVAPSTSGAAQWAVDRPCDGGKLGCVGRVGPTSPLTGPTGLLNRPRPVGVPLARLCIEGHEFRSGHHQRTKRQIPALATLVRHREPMRRAFHELFPERALARRHATAGVVCLGRDAAACRRRARHCCQRRAASRHRKTRTKAALQLKRRRADVVCAVGKKAPQKAGPQYLLHEGVPAKGSPS